LNQAIRTSATVRAELRSEIAKAQVVRFEMDGPVDSIMTDQRNLYVNLCLTPRPRDARASYPNRWSPNRFERLGEIFLVPPGEVLRARSEGGVQTSMVCQINAELFDRWFEGRLDWNDWRLEAALHISDLSIRGLLMRLTRELCHPGFASDVLVELMVPQLVVEIGRYCASIEESRTKTGLAAWRLRVIDERVSDVSKPPALSELADLCHLSVRQLSRAFRISRGCSIGQYVEQSRVENAKRLLMAGQSIKTIAHSMGFSSPSSFSYAFRRITGTSPAEYRDRV
jgi:AraC family transcriptional regulator